MTNDIRYIAVSDVHLGAANSILTHPEDATTRVDARQPGPAMPLFVDCLHALVAGNQAPRGRP